VSKVTGSTNWSYLLTLGFIINAALVLCLVVYILRRRKNKAGKQSLLDKVKSPANRFKNIAAKGLSSTVGYNDYQESSSEIEDFVKPFHDSPDEEKFLKPYRDDE